MLLTYKETEDVNKKLYIIIYNLIMIFSILCAFTFGLCFKTTNDGLWHIKVGEYIIKNRSIPYNDIFSWYGISLKLKWISHEWLFGIIVYLIYSIKKFSSIGVFLGIINVINSILVYYFAKIRCNNKWISLFCMNFYIAIICFEIGVSLRPSILSVSVILILCVLLEKKKYLLALIILVVGVNLHGGIYPVYLVIFAYYSLNRYKYFIMAILSVLINPYTYNLYFYTINSMKELSLERKFIQEWSFTQIYSLKLALLILLISTFTYAFGKIKLKDMMFSGAFILLSLGSYRHIIFLPVIVMPLMSPYFSTVTKNLFQEIKYNKIKRYLTYCITIGLFQILIFANLLFFIDLSCKRFPMIYLDNSKYPVYACEYINKHTYIKSSHLLSNYNDSPYLIFKGVPTFVDSRADLFMPSYNKGINAFSDYANAYTNFGQTQKFIKKYKINYILTNKLDQVYYVFKDYKNLSIIYKDKNYCIFKVNYYIKK